MALKFGTSPCATNNAAIVKWTLSILALADRKSLTITERIVHMSIVRASGILVLLSLP